jgi:hypothetical protein
MKTFARLLACSLALSSFGCAQVDPNQATGAPGAETRAWHCVLGPGEDPDFLQEIGCQGDFDTLASEPLSASIPGAQSVKTLIDRGDGDTLYFQNSRRFRVHWEFADAHLSVPEHPLVPELGVFNQREYYAPDRRFLLGAVTYYAGPDRFVYEIAPYDNASVEMIRAAYERIRDAAYFGGELMLHPTSEAVTREIAAVGGEIPVITTDELFEGIDYQPLNLGESVGQLRFMTAKDLENDFAGFRDIVVLDRVPNDISAVAGIITQEFQTPLAHINVLSQNRGTPNMGLLGAFDDPALRALAGKWVRFRVGTTSYAVEAVSPEVADAWWEEHKPDPVVVPQANREVTALTDVTELLDLEHLGLLDALKAAIPAFGGKASHYGALASIGDEVPHPDAFAIPVHYYFQFMEQNGFDARVDEMLADPEFQSDPAVRDARLAELRDAMRRAPVDPEFEAVLRAKLAADHPGTRVRFRSSTNAEDLNGFTGAGLYTSKSGSLDEPEYPLLDPVRDVWASLWRFRAFEERTYRSIPHQEIGMALLVHRSFPEEDANGVAITANIFDPTGLDPAFYVNVQAGEASVVLPDPGDTTDQFLYHYDHPGQPTVYLVRSNLVTEGESVLTGEQIHALGTALSAIHGYFAPAYGPGAPGYLGYYAMDVEFKFNTDSGEQSRLWVKQARPYPGRGMNTE